MRRTTLTAVAVAVADIHTDTRQTQTTTLINSTMPISITVTIRMYRFIECSSGIAKQQATSATSATLTRLYNPHASTGVYGY